VVATGMPIEEEVRHLKRMIEEIKSAQDDGGAGTGAQALLSQSALSTPALQDAFEQLVVNGVDKRLALSVIRRAGFELGGDGSQNPDNVVERVASEIMESTTVEPPLSGLVSRAQRPTAGPTVIALVGPTGVGKTTTVAKIASEALLKRNMKVGLINLDNYKMAAFDQLGTYAKILNVPFRTVSGTEELQAAIKDFNALDLVIVDTAGRSQRDPGSLKETEQILATVEGLHVHLVLAVTTRDAELYDMASRFSVFRPTGIIASKLDEATIYGAIYNVTQKTKLPLLYFTTGQRVPEDIEEATRERVAALIMDL
jgi:flagellar biosynthesis protein FlhF